MKRFLLSAASVLTLASAWGEAALADGTEAVQTLDPVVVTATKTATKLSDVPASVSVITAEEIESQGSASVGDIISRTPGVSFYSSGGIGASGFAQFRGLPGEHTLVLIDGVRMNNPVDANQKGAFNFEGLIAHDIERIEIVRGPQATLWGSSASGGVINIITKHAEAEGFHGGLKAEYGSYATRRLDGDVNYGGKIGVMPFSLHYAHSEYLANGPNISDEDRQFKPYPRETVPSESDRRIVYDNSLDFRMHPSEDVSGRFFLTVNDLSTDLDSGGQDTDYNKDSRTYAYGTSWDIKLLDGRLENKETISGMNAAMDNYRPSASTYHYSSYRAETLNFEHQSTYHLTERYNLIGNLSWDKTDGKIISNKALKFDDSEYHGSSQIQLQGQPIDHLHLLLGLSYDSFSAYDNKATYRGGVSYDFPTGTTVRTSAGTGYRAPSLNQQYYYDNPKTLKPEESTLYEVGVDQVVVKDRLKVGVTAFHNMVENIIVANKDSGGNYYYANNDEMTSKGLETTLTARVYQGETDNLDLFANYTYTISQFSSNTSSGTWDNHASDKIPPHSATISAVYGFDSGRGSLRGDVTIKSRSWEQYHKDSSNTSNSYVQVYDGDGWKLDIAGQYEFSPGWTAYGRVENVFDAEYYTSHGYVAAPFGVYAGVGYKF